MFPAILSEKAHPAFLSLEKPERWITQKSFALFSALEECTEDLEEEAFEEMLRKSSPALTRRFRDAVRCTTQLEGLR
jgi:hypothetical protein